MEYAKLLGQALEEIDSEIENLQTQVDELANTLPGTTEGLSEEDMEIACETQEEIKCLKRQIEELEEEKERTPSVLKEQLDYEHMVQVESRYW